MHKPLAFSKSPGVLIGERLEVLVALATPPSFCFVVRGPYRHGLILPL